MHNFSRMKVTERVGEKLKKDVVPMVEQMLHRPMPEKILQMPLVQRLGAQALKALERLTVLAEKAEEVTLRTPKDGHGLVSDRFEDIRKELESVLRSSRAEKSPAQEPAPQPVKKKTPRKMPEMIRAGGGKRIPAAVAKRAVKASTTEFKPKKGKKLH